MGSGLPLSSGRSQAIDFQVEVAAASSLDLKGPQDHHGNGQKPKTAGQKAVVLDQDIRRRGPSGGGRHQAKAKADACLSPPQNFHGTFLSFIAFIRWRAGQPYPEIAPHALFDADSGLLPAKKGS